MEPDIGALREYLKNHDITKVVDAAVNELFETRPEDICGVLGKIVLRHAQDPVIDHLIAREILDSRGNPTIEVSVFARYLGEINLIASSAAPNGSNPRPNEMKPLYDGVMQRFGGIGVQKAVEVVNTQFSPALSGKSFKSLNELDSILSLIDISPFKEKIGSNSLIATSFALAKSSSIYYSIESTKHVPCLFKYFAVQNEALIDEKGTDLPNPISDPIPEKGNEKPEKGQKSGQNSDLKSTKGKNDIKQAALLAQQAQLQAQQKAEIEQKLQVAMRHIENRVVKTSNSTLFKLPYVYYNIITIYSSPNKYHEVLISPRADIPYPEQLEMAVEVQQTLSQILIKEFGPSSKNIDDFGSFAAFLIPAPPEKPNEKVSNSKNSDSNSKVDPDSKTTDKLGIQSSEKPNLMAFSLEKALFFVEKAIKISGFEINEDIKLALNMNAYDFYNQSTKNYDQFDLDLKSHLSNKSNEELLEYYLNLVKNHPAIMYIEDPFSDNDFEYSSKLLATIGTHVLIAGNSIFSSQPSFLSSGVSKKMCNTVVLKPGEAGTLSDAMYFADCAHAAGLEVIVSETLGENSDSLITDFAVGIGAEGFKGGSLTRGEKVIKYNRLLEIYELLRKENALI